MSSSPWVVRFYVFAVIGAAVAAVWFTAGIVPATPIDGGLAWHILAFVALALALELAEHRLAMGAANGSLAFVMYLSSALVFGPVWCAAIIGVSLTSAQILKRKRPLRIAFNLGQKVLALSVATAFYTTLGGRLPPPSQFFASFWPFAGLTVTYFVLNSAAVSGVVALSERRDFTEVWFRNTVGLAAYDFMASVLALVVAWLYVQVGLWGIAAVVVPLVFLRHTYGVNLRLQETSRELLDLMVKAIEARDPYTSGHSQRVAELAGALARDLRLGLKEVENISTAAILHDVGKIYEEFAPILRKEGRLTPEEKRVMQTHPIRSAELVGTISSLHGYVYKCVRHHHENYDGSGYPDGLVREQIPIGARIVMIADTVDAMTTDRPYRKALPYARVVEELAKHSGKQFDPAIVAVFNNAPSVRRVIENHFKNVEVSRSAESPARIPERVAQLAVR